MRPMRLTSVTLMLHTFRTFIWRPRAMISVQNGSGSLATFRNNISPYGAIACGKKTDGPCPRRVRAVHKLF